MVNVSPAFEHMNETVALLSLTTVSAIFYTLIFILYCLSFRLSYTQLRDDHGKLKRQTACTLVLQTVLLMCATLDVILQNRSAQVMYIDNSTLPGGPLGLPAQLSVVTLTKTRTALNLLEDLLILGVLVWRVQVVWSGTRFFTPLAITSVFLYLGNAGLSILSDVITSNPDSTSLPAIPRIQSIISTTAMVFSVAGSVFMTSMIISRLFFIRRKHIKLMGNSDVAGQYLGIAAMLVESYALDTVWGIGILISFGLKYAPAFNLFSICVTEVDILTNFLVIYRVLSGRALTRQTQDRLSTLRWAPDGAGTTTSGTVEVRQTTVPEEAQPVVSFRDDSV